jgi:hypothetical protein
VELQPEVADEEKPKVLFDPSQFIALASIAALDEQESENVYIWMDALIIQEASKHTSHIDPLDWPVGYKLNNDLVLASEATGHIWIPPDEQLRCEVVAAHHDGKVAGHLGTERTLELVRNTGGRTW